MLKSNCHRHKGRDIADADKFHLDHPKKSRFGLLNTKRFFEAESKIATDYAQKSLVRWSLITCLWRSIWLTLHMFRPSRRMLSAHCQVRSGMGAYLGAARRRVHLATLLPRPPSGYRPDRRQARHAGILQIGLRLAIAQADARPVMPVSFR